MQLNVHCLGASQEVGRSGFLVDAGEKFLLDYGIKLHADHIEYPLPVPSHINAFFLSHAHLDHSGHIPHLYQESSFMSYMTAPTLDLARLLWFDAIKIANQEGLVPAFSKEDIETATNNTFTLKYRQKMHVTDNTDATLFDAGHIQGAALTKLTFKNDKSLLYTGDFKLNKQRLFPGADFKHAGTAEYLMIESCYGDRNHPPRKELERKFTQSVKETLSRGGHVLIAAFAIGRSQEVLDILIENGVKANFYLDGLGTRVLNVLFDHPEFLENPKKLKKDFKKVHIIKSRNQRKHALKEPSVIVTTSGMLQGGPIIYYLKEKISDKNSKLYLTGFQVKNTPGRILLDTNKIILDGVQHKAQIPIEHYEFSAHPGHDELFKAVESVSPEKVIIVHGDPKVEKSFAKELNEKGFDAVAPKVGDIVKLG